MSQPDLWYTRCGVPTAFGLALRRGHLHDELAAEGVAFRSLQHSEERGNRESHFTHTLANSFRQGGNIPSIWARAQGSDTRLIGLAWTEAPHVILTTPDSGIRTVKDLKGRRLALRRNPKTLIDFSNALALRAYKTVLATEGLTLNDVQIVDFPLEHDNFAARGTAKEDKANPRVRDASATAHAHQGRVLRNRDAFALIRGEVDAIFHETGTSARIANLLGLHTVIDTRSLPQTLQRANNAVPQAFTVSAALIRERPDLVVKVLAHSIETAAWAKANSALALRELAVETGNSERDVEQAYGLEVTQTLALDLSPANLAAIHDIKRFLFEHDFIKRDFNLEEWVDPEPLAAAYRLVAERAAVRTRVPALSST